MLRDPPQLRQKRLAHFVASGTGRVGREVDCANGLAIALEYRHRYRAQAALELLVDDCKALAWSSRTRSNNACRSVMV